MSTLLSIHFIAELRGDGLLPELAATLARPIPKVAEPVDVLSDSEALFLHNFIKRPAGRV